MLFSLRNDVVAIEYPIQYFISEGLRNGEFPVWFNTWSMGFPLQSILSWSVYSTPQMLIGILADYNIYTLHAEFIFFIIASGCCMYKLLKTHFINDKNLSLLFSCCYMLSGFTVGSSQWLLYITAMTFIPLIIYCLLSLFKKPSLKYSILLTISFFLLFTNVHIYLTLVSSYILLIFLITYFIRLILTKKITRDYKLKITKQVLIAFLLTIFLCAAPAFYSYEVISYLSRSQPLLNDSAFFQSNYLHPKGLSSLLLPLSSIRNFYPNTEGIINNTYTGLLPLLLLPASIIINLKQKNKSAWGILMVSLLFLFISFGHLLPLRGWLNIFPGMAHFRHPGVLRIFFILSYILYLAFSFKKCSLPFLFEKKTPERKSIIITSILLMLISTVVLLFNQISLPGIWKGSIYQTIKNVSKEELLAIGAFIQILLIAAILFTIYKKQHFFSFIIVFELIINTLACTPFFSISTYSVKEVNKILSSTKGFPVQELSPDDIPVTITDSRSNSWFNINIYRKEISNNISMPGPLIFKDVAAFLYADSAQKWLTDKKIVFFNSSSIPATDSIHVFEQFPGKVSCNISLSAPKEIILQQAAFPGWKAYYNNKQIALSKNKTPFVSVIAPAGAGHLVFRFEKPGVFYSAIFIHLAILIALSVLFVRKIKFKLSSPL
jgi:hypothetical protein